MSSSILLCPARHVTHSEVYHDKLKCIKSVSADKQEEGRYVMASQGDDQRGKAGMAGLLAPNARLEGGPDEARLRAISRVMAAQAGREESVRRFRADLLGGNLLAPDQIEAWIQRQVEHDGEASFWLSGVAVNPEEIQGEPNGYVKVGPFRIQPNWSRKSHEEPSLSRHMLYFIAPERPLGSEPVRAGGVLETLRQRAKEMTDGDPPQYWWEPQQAVTFILTGHIPLAKKHIEMHPRRRGQRDMSQRHLELAVFTEEHTGETLAARMTVWNAEHPEWAYKQTTTFGWDSRQSVKRLLGILETPGKRDEDEKQRPGTRDIVHAFGQREDERSGVWTSDVKPATQQGETRQGGESASPRLEMSGQAQLAQYGRHFRRLQAQLLLAGDELTAELIASTLSIIEADADQERALKVAEALRALLSSYLAAEQGDMPS